MFYYVPVLLHHPVINTVCMLPEQEDVEWHSDRIPLSTDPNGLEDPRVFQLVDDQVVLKHTWLLNTHISTFEKQCHYQQDAVRLD